MRRSDQAYYWSDAWQSEERESLDAIAAGDSHLFESAEEVVKWLRGGCTAPPSGSAEEGSRDG